MILYGAGGHAKVIMDILEAAGDGVTAVWDDAEKPPMRGFRIEKPPLVMPAREEIIISVGNNRIRKKIAAALSRNIVFGRGIHPRSIIAASVVTGPGTVVMAGAVMNADSTAGDHCIINTNAVVEHDCVLEDYVHVSPGAILCGGVFIGEGTHVGAGAVVIPGVRIGRWCTIGAGAVVIRDIPDHTTAVGNPAYILQKENR